MRIEDLNKGDIVIFGRGGTSSGQLTVGQIEDFNGPAKVKVIAHERRGRPEKPVGVIWTCHPSVILQVVGNEPISKTPRGMSALAATMIVPIMKQERKDRANEWKGKLPKDWKTGQWYYHRNSNRIVRINKVHQKNATVSIMHARHNSDGTMTYANPYDQKLNGVSLQRALRGRYPGDPEIDGSHIYDPAIHEDPALCK